MVSGSLKMGTEDQIVCSEEPSLPEADSLPLCTDSIPACRSAFSTAQSLLPNSPTKDSARGCAACGCHVEPLHRFKEDEAVRDLCSSCILFLCRGMYCCLCFGVYEDSSEGSRLTCTKCQRTSHLACVRNCPFPTVSTVFTCKDCSKLEEIAIKDTGTSTGDCTENGSIPLKKLRRSDNQQICPEEALTATHIVAIIAVRQAKEAKTRARTLAGAAVGAASRAKAALDVAHRAVLEEARWKSESSRRFVGSLHGKNRGPLSLSVSNAPTTSRIDGRVSVTNLQHLNSHTPSYKDQLGMESPSLGDAPSNARFSSPYSKMKGSQPSVETMKTSTSSQDAFPRASVFQKPRAVCVQGVDRSLFIESEGPLVSASPASILDAAKSLDTPRLSSLARPSSAHMGMAKSTEKTSSFSTVLTRNDLASGSSQLSVSKDQLTITDSKASEEVSASAS